LKTSFTKDPVKKSQWHGFVEKAMLADAPYIFEDVILAITIFLEPVILSLSLREVFYCNWTAPGPWTRIGQKPG